MNKIKLIIIIFLIPLFGIGQIEKQSEIIKPQIDERVELLGVVFRLAEAEEYINGYLPQYTTLEDDYFVEYKKHKLIDFTKKIRRKNGVGYDAVMNLAVNLTIDDNKILINKNINKDNIDSRWGKYLDKYIILLNDFYTETSFHNFFKSNKEFYKKTEVNFTEILSKINFKWFDEYYRQTPENDFNLIIALNTNGGNYGADVEYSDGSKNIFSIIGAWQTDSLGIPTFNNDYILLIIHEFSHSYCNPVIDKNYDILREKADEIFKPVKDKMKRQAYSNSKTMLYETLVRASVIKYLQANIDSVMITTEKVKRLITREYVKGFIWIRELVDLLDKYIGGDYKNLNEFALKIAELQNSISVEEKINEINNNSANIISSTPTKNENNVDPNLTRIIIEFDKSMLFVNGLAYGKGGKKTFPEIENSEWNKETKKQYIMKVRLEPNKEYSIKFPKEFFSDEEYGYPLKETYILNFKTAKE